MPKPTPESVAAAFRYAASIWPSEMAENLMDVLADYAEQRMCDHEPQKRGRKCSGCDWYPVGSIIATWKKTWEL